MERIIRIQLEHLPEGVYLATSDDIQGLVAQGRTIAETLEIARDIAKKLLEEQGVSDTPTDLKFEKLEFPLVVGV